jgi:F0F1-type ATP synthase delta subunit
VAHKMEPEAVRKEFTLPLSVVGPIEVRRMIRELANLDDHMRQAALRKEAEASTLPQVTRSLHDVADGNNLNLLKPTDRAMIAKLLDYLIESAPVVHMSFATDPSSAFMNKILVWFRQNVHPAILVQIGLQPTIGGGCAIRTDSKYFDFSLRQHLFENRDLLLKGLAAMGTKGDQPVVAPVAQSQPAASNTKVTHG